MLGLEADLSQQPVSMVVVILCEGDLDLIGGVRKAETIVGSRERMNEIK